MDQPTAFVTGAGSGIGSAVAQALLAEGYRVALMGRRREPLEQLARSHDPGGEQTLVVPGDVSRPDDVEAAFDSVIDRWGRLDLLVNNAGTNAPAVLLEDLTVADWQAVVDVNLTGAFLCVRSAFRVMKAQQPAGGRIINNGSISAITPRPRSTPYTATKHAITGLTKAAALDGREFGIAVGQIDIGNAGSAMTTQIQDGVLQANGQIAPEPVMDVGHVARAVVYMASLPLDANVLTMTVMATGMPFVGRG